MSKPTAKYEKMLNYLSDWVKQAAAEDISQLQQLVDTASAYLHAAEELTHEEIRLLENYLTRDLDAFVDNWQRAAADSPWWQANKASLWSLLGGLADRNTLELAEFNSDLSHQGIYQADEWIAVGDLVCTRCGHHHPIEFAQQITPCLACGHRQFNRVDLPA